MRCPVDDRILIEYLEGELEGPAAAEIGQHVAACNQCHNRLAQLEAACRAVADRVSDFSPPDESFWKDNLESVARATWLKEESAGVVGPRRWNRLVPFVAAAAVILLALVGTFRTGLFTQPGQQETTVAQVDTVSTEALVDSLYMLARLAEQCQMAYQAMEAIEEIGSNSEDSPYEEYPATGNVYDALLGMEDEQVEQVLYVLASN